MVKLLRSKVLLHLRSYEVLLLNLRDNDGLRDNVLLNHWLLDDLLPNDLLLLDHRLLNDALSDDLTLNNVLLPKSLPKEQTTVPTSTSNARRRQRRKCNQCDHESFHSDKSSLSPNSSPTS